VLAKSSTAGGISEDTENARRSNKGYAKSQLRMVLLACPSESLNGIEEDIVVRKRQLTEKEKQHLREQYRDDDGYVRCFVDGAPIKDESSIEYHHIANFANGGPTSLDNMAPVCREHHKRIGTLSLEEFRDKINLEEFFKEQSPRLDSLLREKVGPNGFGHAVSTEVSSDRSSITLYLDDSTRTYPLYECPVTHTPYFYAHIPVRYINNDDEIQPRPLEAARVWNLCRHFRTATQLSPAICRLVDDHILLLDGQHKTAAQVWLGREGVECKVYIEPDVQRLKETLLLAHDKLRQMAFYTSTLTAKIADLFREEWQGYVETRGTKTETGFVHFMMNATNISRRDAIKRITAAIYDDILTDDNNKLQEFIADRRSKQHPLTTFAVQNHFLKLFVAPPPLEVEIEGPDDHRAAEKGNIVALMNIVAEETLIERWNPSANNEDHRKAQRIYLSGAFRAWARLLRDVIAVQLRLFTDEEKAQLLFRSIEEEDWERIRRMIQKLFSHKLWLDPNPDIVDSLRIAGLDPPQRCFKEHGLTVGWLLGAEE